MDFLPIFIFVAERVENLKRKKGLDSCDTQKLNEKRCKEEEENVNETNRNENAFIFLNIVIALPGAFRSACFLLR